MKPAIRSTTRPLAVLIALGIGAACSESPLESPDGASSTVVFSLAGAKTSSGHDVCAETDAARLSTTPSGQSARLQNQSISDSECGTTFTVTVPKGTVNFQAELLGGQRPLFRGSKSEAIEKDGFRVVIDLEEIDALNVKTKTLGPYGPINYLYQVAGNPDFELIGKDDTITVAALAGGPRRVTLDPRPCAVVNGPPELDVPIPTQETSLGDHEFEVDCDIGGGLTVEIDTQGPGGPPTYTLGIDTDDETVSEAVPPDATRFFPDLGPGPLEITLTGTGPCVVTLDTPDPFMPVAGSLVVTFTVTCTEIIVPPPVPTGTLLVETRAPGVAQPFPTPPFDLIVTGSGSTSLTRPMRANATETFPGLLVGESPYTVELVSLFNNCHIANQGPSQQMVSVPQNGTASVLFLVDCT